MSFKEKVQGASGGLGWLVVGFSGALIFCWFVWVRPLQSHLDARERALQEWERLNRQEREAVGTIKNVAVEEIRKWVGIVDEQNRRFTELQRSLHRQEVELAGPATSFILIAALTLLGVVALVAFWMRDSNSAAAVTLENVAALAPEEMVRSILVTALSQKEPITISLTNSTRLPELRGEIPALEEAPLSGVVQSYRQEKGFGFIQPDKGEK